MKAWDHPDVFGETDGGSEDTAGGCMSSRMGFRGSSLRPGVELRRLPHTRLVVSALRECHIQGPLQIPQRPPIMSTEWFAETLGKGDSP